MLNTLTEYDTAINTCASLFFKKMSDYGTAWRNLRPTSITDQIFIKAQRIKSIEEKGFQKVADDIKSEYIGIVNYCIIGLMQLELFNDQRMDIPPLEIETLYKKQTQKTRQLMLDKNHDYGEAWRDMRISSLTDLILMKIFRVKQIEDNKGKTTVSEGIDANYMDMLNYSVFALIKLSAPGIAAM
ncbi:MAG: DUF1599 domain-containing protein [Bacteroidetes bacterium]|nr:DUF1599 domain-containing protein [Bacteroidota bacterium]